MFARFTQSARDATLAAQRIATEGRAGELRAEHIALGLLDASHTPGARALRAAGCTPGTHAAIVTDLTTLNRRAGITPTDADALRGLGIDIDEVLGRLQERPPTPPPRRRGRGLFGLSGHVRGVRWTASAKAIVERALREALDLRVNHIDDSHLLLALLGGGGVVAETMAVHDVRYVDVRRVITEAAAS